MSATAKAVCPGCRSLLAIPAWMLGQTVRCTKCGAVLRSKPKATAPAAPAPVPSAGASEAEPTYAPPAGPFYAPPAVTYPMPEPVAVTPPPADEMDFAPSAATRGHARRGRYRKPGGGRKLVGAVVLLVVAGGLVAAGVAGAKYLPGLIAEARQPGEGKPEPEQPKPAPVAAGGVFPRRLLFVHASNYLYLNPLTGAPAPGNSTPQDRTRGQAQKLALQWRVPDDQLYVVSDTDKRAADRRPPVKSVLVAAFDQFFETSRAQDRIAVYFGGHVLSKKTDAGEVVFLVPLEGDPDDDATLIPLAAVYEKLATCKATQKVMIWDVCRFNPDRGRQRPGSEPMSEAVAKALSAAPPGVQVVMTCGAGQNALEFTSLAADGPTKPPVAGSSFLEAVYAVAAKRGAGKPAAPGDPLPVDEWAGTLGKRVAEVAAAADGKPEQTLALSGGPPVELAAADGAEPPPARFDIPAPPKGADEKEVRALVDEFALPGIKADDDPGGVAGFPFPASALAAYKADVPLAAVKDKANADKYLFRVKVLDALALMRSIWAKDGKPQLREEFVGDTTDAIKKEITQEQNAPADAIARLEAALRLLEAVEPQRAEQPKRWQAHFDYALAQAKLRVAFLQEYNLALGNIKTEVLPARDPKRGHDGFKLVAAANMKAKDAKKQAEEAREVLDRLVTDFPGSPWAVQAKRDRALNLGLAWQPFNSKAAAAKDD